MANSVSLCMIVRNEAANLDQLLTEVLQVVDEAHIVDTGSTDATLDILRSKQKVFPFLHIHSFKWIDNFSAARNFSFSHATKDWIFWVDGDDRVDTRELRKFKDSFLDNGSVDAWLLDYIYSRFPDGSPQTTLGRERFLRRSVNPRWIGAIHETVDISCMRQAEYKDLKIVHNRAGKNIDPRRNVNILASEFDKNPNDPRTCYYYGKELFDLVDDRGIEVLERYLTLPGRWYDDEVNARFRLGKAYVVRGKHREAVRMAEEIYHLDQTRLRAEGYWLLGRVEQDLGNFEIAIKWYLRCLDGPPPPPRVLNLEYFTWNPSRRIAECYKALGKTNLAAEWAQKVQELLPGDPDTLKWAGSLKTRVKVEVKGGLRILEWNTRLRSDSTQIQDASLATIDLDPESLDGLVVAGAPGVLLDAVKPGGFIWVASKNTDDLLFGASYLLGTATYNGQAVWNFIKPYPGRPYIRISEGDREFGPYRIRQHNLELSAKKAGYKVVIGNIVLPKDEEAAFYFSPNLFRADRGKVKVLDCCEELPKDMYEHKGIQYADLVTVCTESLQRHVQKLYPQKKVVVLEDHFEMTAEEWL